MITGEFDDSELNDFFGAVEARFTQHIHAATRVALALLLTAVRKGTPVTFGNLRRSIQADVRGRVTNIEGRIASPLNYAPAVEFGTRPHFPPIAPLKLWARRKLGDEGAAYAVQKAIGKRGTKGHFMFQKAWEKGKDKAIRRITDAVDEFFRGCQ